MPVMVFSVAAEQACAGLKPGHPVLSDYGLYMGIKYER